MSSQIHELTATATTTRKLLLIEDDRTEALVIQSMLALSRSIMFDTKRVRSIRESLRALEKDQFDLVLLDLAVTDAGGLQSVGRLIASGCRVPIVVLSETDDELTALESVQEGAQDYLVRGQFDQRLLHRTIRHAIARNRILRELETSRQRQHFLATHDSVTGLLNRPQFCEYLVESLAYADRYKEKLAVFYVDLDQFKTINDGMGHAGGDAVLQGVADRLRACLRTSDNVARVAGDEFLVLLRNLARAEDAGRVATNIIRALSEPFEIDKRDVYLSASIGISLFPQDSKDAETMISSADRAMTYAKEQGRGTFHFFTRRLNEMARRRRTIETRLREALRKDQFLLHYQPQVDTDQRQVVGAEALIRWRHPDLGLIPPGEFIPIAEDSGLIDPIGEWVLRSACEQHRRWRTDGLPPLRLGVNLSVCQIERHDLLARVERIMVETGMDPSALDLEITESLIMKDTSHSLDTLRALKEMGIRISIDDFGIGHSSLAYLQRFPCDSLKIDRSFVRDLVSDPSATAITTAIIAMANHLQLDTIAEGVETVTQLDFLRSNQCHQMQGFLFSRPVKPEDFRSFCSRGGQTAMDTVFSDLDSPTPPETLEPAVD